MPPIPKLSEHNSYVMNWLYYGTFVDQEKKIFYAETPKTGCTSIKHFFREFYGLGEIAVRPGTGQSRANMVIHTRREIPMRTLPSFSDREQEDIVRGPGWFRFCVTRHPFARFFAAWRDKIFLCEPGVASSKFVPSGDRKYVDFWDFYAKVMAEDDPFSCDPHWRSQASLLLPEDIHYSRIYDISELASLRDDLDRHLRKLGREERLPELKKYNEGYKISSAGFVTPSVAEGLKRFYESDFAYFSFPEFEAPDVPQASAAALTSELTDAIFDRNRFIAASDNAYDAERAGWESRARESQVTIEAQGDQLRRLTEEFQQLAGAAEERLGDLQRLATERQQLADLAESRLTEIGDLARRYDPRRMTWKGLLVYLASVIRAKLSRSPREVE